MLLFLILSLTITTNNATTVDDDRVRILVLGDSLSAAYGIPKEAGWVNLMRREMGDAYQVINASISGETTVGGLNRLPTHLLDYKPNILIIELGANDGLRGHPIHLIQENLTKLTQLGKKSGAKVILAGIHIPPNYGSRYTQAFYDIYETVAAEESVELIPFLLENVAIYPELMQKDQLHPKANAQPIILENVMRILNKIIETLF